MSRPLMFVLCAIGALAPAAVLAHHSRANYDMTKEIVVEGTVADLAWTNPHISMTLETQSPGGKQSRLQIELASVSEALALGLKKEAIEPGAHVVVRAHPGRSGPGRRLWASTSEPATARSIRSTLTPSSRSRLRRGQPAESPGIGRRRWRVTPALRSLRGPCKSRRRGERLRPKRGALRPEPAAPCRASRSRHRFSRSFRICARSRSMM